VQGVLAAEQSSYLLLKNVTSDELVSAIRAATLGSSTLRLKPQGADFQATRPSKQPLFDLTDREQEVLQWLLKVHSNQQIADILVISLATVKAHHQQYPLKRQVLQPVGAIAFGH